MQLVSLVFYYIFDFFLKLELSQKKVFLYDKFKVGFDPSGLTKLVLILQFLILISTEICL